MSVTVVDHPLVAHRITRLRDAATDPPSFRRLAGEVAGLLAYEATRNLATEPVEVPTPLGVRAPGRRLLQPGPMVVPVLRAGLGLLGGVLSVLEEAQVGVIGLRRDDETFLPTQYCISLPDDLRGRVALVLDPMLATGGTLAATCEVIKARGAGPVVALCLIAAPEGVRRMAEHHRDVTIVAAALDPGLDERAFIVPGLGDAGDRLFGPP